MVARLYSVARVFGGLVGASVVKDSSCVSSITGGNAAAQPFKK